MEQETSLKISGTQSLLKPLLTAGFIVGTLDGLAAVASSYIQRGVTPDRVFKYVATGVYGQDALTAGTGTALMGLLFHYIIAFGWTTLFFILYPRLKFLSSDKYLAGIVYGVFVLLSMNLVVIPLSNVPSPNPGTVNVIQLFIHMFIVGLPISLLANRYYSKQLNG
jgi:hypothetical protein